MAKINILGTIVSADYDDDFFATWIDKGIITPSSRIVSALESATEPIDLYINSYGGDVFAGGEMLIALQKCFAEGRLASVEVGSIAASMAANIVASLKTCGARIVASSNSQLMFHGCYTSTIGGAQHHEDVAESLRNINESVIKSLNKIGITDCRAWFAEGREKWISADDALKIGLIDEISDDVIASAPVDAKRTASRLAAFAAHLNNRKDYKMEVDTIVDEVKTEPIVKAVATEAVTTEAAKPTEETLEARVEKLANERFAALQSKHDKMISELRAERTKLTEDLTAANAKVTSLEADLAKSAEDLATVRNQLEAEKKAHESVIASALKPTKVESAWTKAYKAIKH